MAEHPVARVVCLCLLRAIGPIDLINVIGCVIMPGGGLSQAGQICLNSRELAVSGIVRVVGLVITRIGD